MKKVIKTEFTEAEIRQIIREEVRAVLYNEDGQVAGTDQEGFINLDQAAEFLKVAKQTLYARTSAGTIPFVKKGKRLLFKKSELAAWLNETEKEK
jgi:excisionase family DNA binding protein